MKKMMKLNIAICDDNKLVLENEKTLIEETLKEMGMPYKMDKYQNPENLIKNAWQYDVVFLDVEMDEVNGIVAAESIHNINKECLLFFVTNHEVYMDYAMNEYAFRFWVKPMSKEKLKFGLESALKRLESNNKCIEFNTDRNVVNIPINKIIFICAENKKTTIVTVDEQFVVDRPYKAVKDMINSYFEYLKNNKYKGITIRNEVTKGYNSFEKNIKFDMLNSLVMKGACPQDSSLYFRVNKYFELKFDNDFIDMGTHPIIWETSSYGNDAYTVFTRTVTMHYSIQENEEVLETEYKGKVILWIVVLEVIYLLLSVAILKKNNIV